MSSPDTPCPCRTLIPTRRPGARGSDPGARSGSQLTLGPTRKSHAAPGTRSVARIDGDTVSAVVGPTNVEAHAAGAGGQGPKTISLFRSTVTIDASRSNGTCGKSTRRYAAIPLLRRMVEAP